MNIATLIRGGAAATAAACLLAVSAASPAATLTVYTAVEAEDLKKYAARFNEDHPDIEIKWSAIPPASSPRSSWPRRTTPRPT